MTNAHTVVGDAGAECLSRLCGYVRDGDTRFRCGIVKVWWAWRLGSRAEAEMIKQFVERVFGVCI